MRLLLARLAAAVLATSAAGLGLVAGTSAPATAAACSGATGVTVVVDHGALGGGVDQVCNAGGRRNAASSLFTGAGFSLTYVQRQPGFVCRINGQPASDPCVNTPPSNAYWGLWWSDGKSGSWSYSSLGAGSLTVPNGGYVAFAWQTGSLNAPNVVPTPHASTPTPAPTPTATPTSGWWRERWSRQRRRPGRRARRPATPTVKPSSKPPSTGPTRADLGADGDPVRQPGARHGRSGRDERIGRRQPRGAADRGPVRRRPALASDSTTAAATTSVRVDRSCGHPGRELRRHCWGTAGVGGADWCSSPWRRRRRGVPAAATAPD